MGVPFNARSILVSFSCYIQTDSLIGFVFSHISQKSCNKPAVLCVASNKQLTDKASNQLVSLSKQIKQI